MVETLNVTELIEAVLTEYALPWDGPHGVLHWGRVLENGLRLADATGVSRDIVTLFAVFHDSRRFNEGFDPDHGMRGAQLAERFRGQLFDLDDRDFELFQFACFWHTDEVHHDNPSIQCCWDADRLDLGRVGMEPDPEFLNTEAAKSKELRRWAHGRAMMNFVTDSVREICDRRTISDRSISTPSGRRP